MANREEASSSKMPDEEPAPAKADTVVLWMSSENSAVRRAPLSHEEIGNLSVVCTSCGEQINHHDKRKVHLHRLLNVLVCKRCHGYYGETANFKKMTVAPMSTVPGAPKAETCLCATSAPALFARTAFAATSRDER
ncbi:hypothetical protein MRX96_038815 [Rhipicephalus microplus]